MHSPCVGDPKKLSSSKVLGVNQAKLPFPAVPKEEEINRINKFLILRLFLNNIKYIFNIRMCLTSLNCK